MIKPRIGICIDCGPESKPIQLVAGRCQSHYWRKRHNINQAKKREQIINDPVLLKEKTSLGLWFKYHIDHNLWICENCGDKIEHYNSELCYSAQAHILPKSIFKSVQSNLDNHMSLCSMFSRNNCHAAFDASWSRASRMEVFEVAKFRLLKFIRIIPKWEMAKLPEVFQNLISQ